MTLTANRQAVAAFRTYALDVTAEPLELNSTVALSMADRAYAAITDQLIMLEIRPNDPIDDGALAQELGIGRTPVREALKRLEGDRLVVAYPRRGHSPPASISPIWQVSRRSAPNWSHWQRGALPSAPPVRPARNWAIWRPGPHRWMWPPWIEPS